MRWQITPDGKGLVWRIPGSSLPHADDLEMTGETASFIFRYEAGADAALSLSATAIFPTMRVRPNNTYGSWKVPLDHAAMAALTRDGVPCAERLTQVTLDGVLTLESDADGLAVTRTVFPSPTGRSVYLLTAVCNTGTAPVSVCPPDDRTIIARETGTNGAYRCERRVTPSSARIRQGETVFFSVSFHALRAGEESPDDRARAELAARRARIDALTGSACLSTGDPHIDLMYRFAQIRSGESLIRTKGGLLHAPGGGLYYAALWCNDSVEYAMPWFGYTGDPAEREATLCAIRAFRSFMDDSYTPIPSSIIAEGEDIWNGAGDRGDAAMYLFGVGRFVLEYGDLATAKEVYPALAWCAEYCEKQKTADGIIASDTDEMEGRIPTGGYNLSTSCLCYGGLTLLSALARSLGKTEDAARYAARAADLSGAIDRVFGRELHGRKTYRYCEADDRLRAWITLPVYMGIAGDRTAGTMDLLFSDVLLTGNGIRSAEGLDIIWDRSYLYAVASAFLGDRAEDGYTQLRRLTDVRLLGERVPYCIEAYPENDMRHLSAESALYCRIVTDGLFGMRPEGLDRFSLCVRLPDALPSVTLANVRAFGRVFTIAADRDNVRVTVGDRVIFTGRPGVRETVILP